MENLENQRLTDRLYHSYLKQQQENGQGSNRTNPSLKNQQSQTSRLVPRIAMKKYQKLEKLDDLQVTINNGKYKKLQGKILLNSSINASIVQNQTQGVQQSIQVQPRMNIHDNSLSNDMSAIKMDNSVDFTRNNNTTILKDLKIIEKQDKINKKKIAAQKKKNEDLTPLDFINLIRQDPEMRDEFCYLNRRNHAYDYKIVDYDKRNKDEYMTISARGITHYVDNVGDFIKIERWEQEVKQFNKLGQIQFFKEYKIWKNFYIWKKLTRKNIMKKCQNVLVQNLFILDRHLQKPLLEAKDISQQIAKLEFMDLLIQEPISIVNFRDKQEKFRQTIMLQSFDLLETQIKDIIISSCRNSLSAFKVEHRIPNENQNDNQQPLLIGDEQKKDMPYTQEATIKTHYKRLRKYVKMIDYFTFNSKVSMIIHSVEILCNSLVEFIKNTNQNQRQNAWLICKVKNKNNEISFKPNKELTIEIFEEIVQKGIANVYEKTKFFIHRPDIRAYTDSDVDPSKLLDLKTIVSIDRQYIQKTVELKKITTQLISQVEQYSENLIPFVRIYQENINQSKLNEDSIELELFRQLILKHQKQDVQFNTIESKIDLGIFQINCSKLKDQIKNCAQNCLADIFQQLPIILYHKSCQFLAITSDLNQKLNWTITDSAQNFVEYFVQYCENVNKSNDLLSDLSFQIQDINGLLSLIIEFKIKIPENYKQKVTEANQSITNLRKKTEEAQAQYDQNLTKCSRKLEKQVPEVSDKIKYLQDLLYTSNLDDKKQDINSIVDLLADLKLQINDIVEVTKKINKFQMTLSLDVKHFEKLEELLPEFSIIERLWVSRQEFYAYQQKVQFQQFLMIDFSYMETFYNKIQKSAAICAKELELNEVSKIFKIEVEKFQTVMETLRPLLDPSMGQKQWDLVRMICQQIVEDEEIFQDINNPKYTFQYIQESGIEDLKENFIEIALHAAKESELIKMTENVELFWKESRITVAPYKNVQDAYILGNNEDMITRLDDTLLTLNNIMASRFVEGIRQRVEHQVKMFRQLQELLDEWAIHQQNYIYLEPILSSSGTQGGLQKESSKFKTAEKQFRQIMRRAKEQPLCKQWADEHINRQYFQTLKNNNATFDIIQKALDDYLEKKREAFTRFFFLSNDELLEILSQAKQPSSMQPHLRKVFENIVKLDLESDEITANAMISAEGEVVQFKQTSIKGVEVEEWMKWVETSMENSLKKATSVAFLMFENEDRKDWVLKHATQVILSIDSIYWTKIAEDQYLQNELSPEDEIGTLDEYIYKIVLDLEEITELIRGDLNPINRRTLVALVTQDVHYRDIIQILYEEGVTKQSDFWWVQQLKFYYSEELIHAKQVSSKLEYGYEYLGALSRLVITPLTDRCWMTITGALHIKLGANPAGPAGTGKTESCKDLAKVLGRFCLVFNCSDQINVKMMQKLFIGLCFTGAWTCLDEFNRIDIEVLSVVAQQVLQIREALLELKPNEGIKSESKHEFNFFGKIVKLNANFGCFITMNPGYAGRTELPDNLKLLFRPIAMMVPDYTLIAEIMLYSEGFANAKDLSKKMTMLYKLSSEQLSQQDHYDFGMRAVKSVLVMAGNLKRANPTQPEDIVLIKAMKDSNIPKFLSHDIPLFNAIVQDLFPGISIPVVENQDLKQTIVQIIQQKNLQLRDQFLEKVQQLHDTLNVRFGVMLVGPALGGKSTILNILRQSYITLWELKGPTSEWFRVEYSTLNPKSISMEELYGNYDPQTQTWTDGLASKLLRHYVSNPENDKRQWVIFDGPVDALWVENMNSVLDDSMVLCLSNGERIKLHPKMKILFEVADLVVASPATVSRCGMVYIDDQVVLSENLVQSYFNSLHESLGINLEITISLKNQIENLLVKLLQFIRKSDEPISTSNQQLTKKMLKFFELMLNPQLVQIINSSNEQQQKKVLNKLVAYCVIWGLGSHLSDDCQVKFQQFASGFFNPSDMPQGQMFSNFLDYTQKPEGVFVHFDEIVPSFTFDKELKYFQLVVPTSDTVCYQYLTNKFIDIKTPIFITGVTGTGKTIMTENTLSNLTEKILEVKMSFSSQTASKSVQLALETKLQQQRKKGQIIMIPPPGKRLAILIDDINMPMVENYGAQPPIELLRQLIDHNGIYDRTGHFFKEVDNYVVIGVAAPPGGGRSVLTQRFTRHFSIFNVRKTSDATLDIIFGSIIKGFLKSNAFKPEIVDLEGQIVQSTLSLYNKISVGLLPTPNKSHYTFNLRDVSKVFQGILMSKPISFPNKKTMILLWAHECLRVFHDRLINQEDQEWILNVIAELGTSYFAENLENIDEIYIVDFLKRGIDVENRLYELCQDFGKLTKVITDIMQEDSKLNLVLFKDACQHLVRITRILRQQRGHFILVGVGGSGKKSLSELGAVLAGAKMMKIEPQKKYGKKEFRIDIFNIMIQAASSNQHIMFLFPDTDIIQEGFLEDVNNLINTGEISGLIGREEMDIITQALQEECRINKINDVYGFFVERVRNQLHIVLAMSPVGDLLRTRFRKFPSLISCCTIDWLQPWPSDALFSVANMFFDTLDYQGMTAQIKQNLCNMCVFVHTSVNNLTEKFYQLMKRRVYTTPKSYIDLVKCYKELLQKKKDQLTGSRNKLVNGLNKLADANATISDLKSKLTELQPILQIKTVQIKDLIESLTKDQQAASIVKKQVESEAREINIQSEKIAELKEEADTVLKEAEPILKAAVEQLDKLNRGDISEIKQNNNPHALVKYTIECVAILLEEKADWDHIKKNVLSDAGLLTKLKNLKGENITPTTKAKIKAKISGNPQFIPSEIQKINLAAKSLCEWVHAVSSFTDIFKDIQTKKDQCVQMDQQLASANAALSIKQKELDIVVQKVLQLEKSYNESKQEKDNLDNEIKQTEGRLVRASQLTEGLADEQIRWQENVIILKEELDVLLGNVFLAASSIAYYGPFTGVYRELIVNEWIEKMVEYELPYSTNYNIQNIMGNAIEIRDWNSKGLPSDTISVNNGILVTNCMSYPLLIDPQTQANKWIKQKEAANQLKIAKLSQDTMIKSVEMCLRMGQPILFEDIEEQLSSLLEPLLSKQFNIVNGRKMVKVGDSEIEYDENFRMYFTTKLQNPHYLPEIFIRVTVINFTVTQEGLQEQLLGDVVKKEMPEVEMVRKELVVQIAQGKVQLKKGEDKILELLTNSKGMILDDIELIESLKISKEVSTAVKEKLQTAESKQEEINQAMSTYTPVAKRGTVLYFVIADLALIDPMYQFSLNYFANLFNLIIENTNQLEDRINILIKNITMTIFENICRGLFNNHKRIFSFLVAAKILISELQIVSLQEWNYLIKGILVIKQIEIPKPEKAAFTDIIWQQFLAIQNDHQIYQDTLQSLTADFATWNKWFTAPNIHLEQSPIEIPNFQKLLIINIFRQEKTVYAIDEFIRNVLGDKFATPAVPTMEQVFNDIDYKTPLIFVLSPGADPMLNLLRFSKEMKITPDKFSIISLGQNQGPIAEAAINSSMKTGGWVLLQNCHLGKSFMPSLEKKLEQLSDPSIQSEINTGFRLFLTSMPCDYFPVTILQNGMKLTNEAPKGLKSNMYKSYMDLTPERMAISNQKENFYKLTFAISLFHALIQERRKFGPIGWNIKYEFNDSDLETSLTVLKSLLEQQSDIPWDALKFVTGMIIYGGRVTDEWDRRCLNSILFKICCKGVLTDNYSFSQSGIYYSPKVGEIQDYKNYIQSFPDEDQPEIFGMNNNANINFQLSESKKVIDIILSIQPKDAVVSSAQSPDDIVQDLCSVLEQKMPSILRFEGEINFMDAMEVCLLQEKDRFNKLIVAINKSLQDIKKAIKGEILMTPILDEMYNSFLKNSIPKIWASKAYPSLKPLGSWFEDFLLRIQFIQNWLENGKPKAFWLSCFFFPQGFLTSILQNYSRRLKIPVDRLSYRYQILAITGYEQIMGPPAEGCYIYGLYAEGFRVETVQNKVVMEDSLPGQIFTNAPVIQFIPSEAFVPKETDFICPVYKTLLRAGTLSTTGSSTNFIIGVQLPTNQKTDYWVLQGAALFCALDR